MALSDDLHLFLQAASLPSDRPTVPTPANETISLPPPPHLPGRRDRIEGAQWLAHRILNTPIIKKLEAELSPETLNELISILHSRPLR